jgi:undecaprenyl-diphosphatase
MLFVEILKAIFIGIVQGITEWLPVSSTGHMIIANEFVNLQISEGAWELFEVITQLVSILAVIILFFNKLNPFKKIEGRVQIEKKTLSLWINVIIAVLPAAVIGVLLDDWLESKFYNFVVVAIMLIVYGFAFIIVERINKKKQFKYTSVNDLDKKTSFKIGCFQVLSLIPGTSRSGSTILGASLIGVSRTAAAEFSFFLAIPVMAGATLLKVAKAFLIDDIILNSTEMLLIFVGTLTAFLVSLAVIKLLMNFVKKHSFESFGWYRIAFGIILLGYYFIFK